MPSTISNYNTLEELKTRKEALRVSIEEESQKIGTLWHELTAPQPTASKGEMIAAVVSNSVTAIDAFILVRKLIKNYGWLLGRKKRK